MKDGDYTVRKFDDLVNLRRAVDYRPIIHNTRWYACIKYLDGHICLLVKSLLPIHFYLELGKN